MSHFPLYAELYEVNGAIYRRPPYRRLNNNDSAPLPDGGDTADVYEDEDDHEEGAFAHDDGPVCGVDESVEDYGAPPGLESVKGLADSLPRPIDPRVTKVGHAIPKWTAIIDVPTNLRSLVIGRGFATKKEIEQSTRCRITIPERGSTSTQIRIDSSSGADSVARCLERIETIVYNAQKQKWTKTHFVALRCHDIGFQRSFNHFIEMVKTIPQCHESMKNDELFPEASKLHVTIAMLCIQTDQDKEKARLALEEVKEKYKKVKPINIQFTGLDIMNDDPSQVHILFGKAVPVPGLQEFFDDIRHVFWKSGLMHNKEKEHDSVKIHMTAMNTRYAVTDSDFDTAKNYANRVPFDASGLLERHPDYPFGWQEADTVTVCELGSLNPTTGYYKTIFEEKVGEARIERCKNLLPRPEYVWQPRKQSTMRQIERQKNE